MEPEIPLLTTSTLKPTNSTSSNKSLSANDMSLGKEREYETLPTSQVIGLIALSNILTFICCFLYNLYSGLQSSSNNYRR